MKQIDSDAASAFMGGYNFSRSNTQVVKTPAACKMYLHGNCIAVRENGYTQLSDCGWQTATTKARLNAILSYWDNEYSNGIWQRDFKWHWKNGEDWWDGWNIID